LYALVACGQNNGFAGIVVGINHFKVNPSSWIIFSNVPELYCAKKSLRSVSVVSTVVVISFVNSCSVIHAGELGDIYCLTKESHKVIILAATIKKSIHFFISLPVYKVKSI
jgi:hypothetical protein